MKRFFLIITFPLLSIFCLIAQKTYTENGGEIILSFADVYYQGNSVPTKMRFTMFLHLGRQRHFDFNDNVGIYSGFGLRNIGLITDQNNIVEKRRSYSLGVPAAFKIGSFSDHFYFFGGGEYEMLFHYKQKQKSDGTKLKYNEWFCDRTNRFVPSLFCGLQFPGGINLKLKYYLRDFLNKDFRGEDFGRQMDYSDFGKSKIFYISLSFNLKTKDIKKLYDPQSRDVRFAEYR